MPTLLEALESKYFAECEFENANEPELHRRADTNDYTVTKCGGRMEFSIFIPRLSPLTCVPELLVLNDCDIDSAGNFDEEVIKQKCQRVRELDLAQNKLRDWEEVFHILKHMPRIEFLNLSKNQLMGPITSFYTAPITNLRNIVLNGTYLDWPCVCVLLEQLPMLEELHLSLNNYTEVLIDTQPPPNQNQNQKQKQKPTTDNEDNETNATATATKKNINENSNELAAEAAAETNTNNDEELKSAVASTQQRADCDEYCQEAASNKRHANCLHISAHPALKTLHFTGNPVERWPEICRLGRVFPNLESLVLADCPINSLHNCERAAHCYFPNLQLLNLSYANLRDWHDIDELAQFPKLKNLRVKQWPLWEQLDCTEHERRQLLIARLPNVVLLNGGGHISNDEREDSERAFIRYYMAKPEAERPSRRYDELLAKHGQLDPLVKISLKPEKRIKVNFIYKEEISECRSIDIYLSVSDLKTKLEKIVGLPANKMRLYYVDQDYKEFGPEEMRFPNKQLYSYNIQAGDEIIIDEKK